MQMTAGQSATVAALEAVLAPHQAALALAVDDTAWDTILSDVLSRSGYRVVQ